MSEFFYKVKGHKVKVKKYDHNTKRYLCEFENGTQQFIPEDLVGLTQERVEDDTKWGQEGRDFGNKKGNNYE